MTKKVQTKSNKEWIIYKDIKKIPPIIEESLWDKANKKLSLKNKYNTNYHNKYLYSKKLICKLHNCHLYRRQQIKKKNDISWICKEHLLSNKCYINTRESEINSIFQSIIEELNINYKEIQRVLTSLYKHEIAIPKIDIIHLILENMFITKELSTYYLEIKLNIDKLLKNKIITKEFIFIRENNHNIKYVITIIDNYLITKY
jgi:hypothetical protein